MKKGFTLIELLVVISIIGILASLTFVSYSGAQKQTRDTERRSDLNQVRNALENFSASNDGLYPGRSNRQNIQDDLCNDLADFISACPDDPGAFVYYYETETTCWGGNVCATRYVLAVELETGDYWEVCSTGEAGKTGHTASSDNNADCRVGQDL